MVRRPSPLPSLEGAGEIGHRQQWMTMIPLLAGRQVTGSDAGLVRLLLAAPAAVRTAEGSARCGRVRGESGERRPAAVMEDDLLQLMYSALYS